MTRLAAALPQAGPACGWVTAYIEVLAAEYRMTLTAIFLSLEVTAGAALCEARACRLSPSGGVGYIDRAIWAARDRCRAELEATHTIIPG